MGYHYFKLQRADKNESKGIFVLEKDEENYVIGDIFEVDGWNDKGKPMSIEKLGNISIKKDGCSHLSLEESDDIHLCGIDNYLEYFELIAFPYVVAEMTIGIIETPNERASKLIKAFKEYYKVIEVLPNGKDEEELYELIDWHYAFEA